MARPVPTSVPRLPLGGGQPLPRRRDGGQPPPRTPVRCPREACRRVMGETDGPHLYLASCMMVRIATLYCIAPSCDGRVFWHPRP